MKKIFVLILFFSTIFSSFATNDSVNFRNDLMNFAENLKGITYHYGGTSTEGFDCSGFVYYVYKNFKMSIPRTSRGYVNYGKKVSLENTKPGDVIVFRGTNPSVKTPGHIGLILKNDNGVIDFIHASSSKKHYGVTVTRFNNSGYVKRFLYIVNVLDD